MVIFRAMKRLERGIFMGARIIAKRNVKIFVLFLMENINYPLDFVSINDIVMQTDYVMYLDFAESFNELLDSELIEYTEVDGEKYYYVTDRGRLVARELHSDILSSILDKSLEAAFRYLDFKKRNIEDGRFDLTCTLYEKKEKIFEVTMVVDTENRVERMKQLYMERPDVIYRGNVALLTGKMGYLFT